jgi:hypothetical protein
MRRLGLGLSLVAGVVAGCANTPNDDPALDALLRVSGAQFYRGAMPAESGGPAVQQLNAVSLVYPGQNNVSMAGLADKETTSVLVGVDGDVGYWVVQPGNSDPLSGFALSFGAPMRFSQIAPNGEYMLIGHAVDLQGHVGPAIQYSFKVSDVGMPGGLPPTTLLVSLRWDTEVDLDLHLVTPDGTEVFSQKVNSYTPQQGDDPSAYLKGGLLDADSNSTCVIDGRRVENIYWTQPPPSGHYIARVETYSLCGDFEATWNLAVTSGAETLGSIVHGFSRDSDTLGHRGKGAGVTAIEFDIP